jgi:hypothetical protein
VNFFGHAVVAAWQTPTPAFVLGAMLPDFATMIGARVPAVHDAGLESGVAFHHATDKVFHDAPTFKRLQANARQRLRELGLPRPSSLAVGHIGVEILLDSVLANDPLGVRCYVDALAEGAPQSLGGKIEWMEPALASRYEELRVRLLERGITRGMADAAVVAFRISRALAPRPRLALEPGGERIVLAWAVETETTVAAAAPALIDEILGGLRQAG